MLKQQDMTAEAKAIYTELTTAPATAGDIAERTRVWPQPVMAASRCENGLLVGVGSACQPFAHAFRSQ